MIVGIIGRQAKSSQHVIKEGTSVRGERRKVYYETILFQRSILSEVTRGDLERIGVVHCTYIILINRLFHLFLFDSVITSPHPFLSQQINPPHYKYTLGLPWKKEVAAVTLQKVTEGRRHEGWLSVASEGTLLVLVS